MVRGREKVLIMTKMEGSIKEAGRKMFNEERVQKY